MTPVVAEFKRLGIPYYIGGSLAASVYGLSRTTLDVDLVVDMKPVHAALLTEALQGRYYVNQHAILDAIARKCCFNVIYLANSFKVDVFVRKDREYDRQAFRRIRPDSFDAAQKTEKWPFPSPEDVVLAKLEWYRLGDEVSDRQWRDIIEVMMTQHSVLDRSYLAHWAAQLQVADLLARAWKEVEG